MFRGFVLEQVSPACAIPSGCARRRTTKPAQILSGAMGSSAGPQPHGHGLDYQTFGSLGYQGFGRHNPMSENSTILFSGLNLKDQVSSPVQPQKFPSNCKGLPAMSFLKISTREDSLSARFLIPVYQRLSKIQICASNGLSQIFTLRDNSSCHTNVCIISNPTYILN